MDCKGQKPDWTNHVWNLAAGFCWLAMLVLIHSDGFRMFEKNVLNIFFPLTQNKSFQ